MKPIKEKSASTIAQFLYEVMCQHGCFGIQIKEDQGWEFVNEVCKQLHELTGVEQRVTSAYHPQVNGLVEHQNRTAENSLVKALEDIPEMWPQIIEGILFAHRVSRHSSTRYSPFMLMFNREPVLPIDVKHNLDKNESKERENRQGDGDEEQPFDLDSFDAIFSSATKARTKIADNVADNFKAAQKKQKRDYDHRHMPKTEIKVDDIVLLKNNKLFDRKGGNFSQKWLGPYAVMNISDKGVATLKNASGMTLKNKYNIAQLKHYIQGAEDKSKSTSNEESANSWNHAPDEIAEMILLYAVQQLENSFPGHK